MEQLHVYYSGRVQGVGFRFSMRRYAQSLGVKGWVKNLPDGRVEICIQGTKLVIDKLCNQIDNDFDGYIIDKEERSEVASRVFESFEISY